MHQGWAYREVQTMHRHHWRSPQECELRMQEQVGGGLEGAAAHTCMATLKGLQAQAQSAGLDGPAGEGSPSWGALCDAVETACQMVTQAPAEPAATAEPSSPSAAGRSLSAAACAGSTIPASFELDPSSHIEPE